MQAQVALPTVRRPSLDAVWCRVLAATPRRRVQMLLGLIWLVDAALQYQPYMFGRPFVTQVLEPAAVGTPSFVRGPSLWAAHLIIHDVAAYNACFATLQLVIALAIFFRPTVRVGLTLSIVWSLAVWWLGEGIGGVTAGVGALMGAPGAVILYAFIALLVWPRRDDTLTPSHPSVAETSLLGPYLPEFAWAVLWLSFAYLGLESANRSPGAMHSMLVGMEPGEPGWIKVLDRGLAALVAHEGTEWSIALTVLYVAVAVGVFSRPFTPPVLVLALVLAAFIWVAEDFGAVFTGSGTDVNSGPLLALFALALWPQWGAIRSSARRI